MIAERMNSMEDSITLALTAVANKMKKKGKDVVSFTAGEPDFDTPEHIKLAGITAIQEGKNKYTPVNGILELRQAICEKLQKENNLIYTPEQIVISVGAKHALFNIFGVILNPGDEVIIPTPYWVSYPPQISFFGGIPVYIETDDTTNFKLSPEKLKNAITEKTKAVIINSPSNPTGMIYSEKELKALSEIILEKNLLVVSDEIYEKLNYSSEPHFSIAQVSSELKERTIVINGVSKSYAMTGWRIGFSASNLKLAKAINSLQSHSTSNPTTNAQWASLKAYNSPDQEAQKMKNEFNKRRIYMVERLNAIPGITCLNPEGAFYAFPNISALFGKTSQNNKTINNSLDFCDALLQEELVSAVPGSGFGAEGYIRLSYATSMEEIKKGLDRLAHWVSTLK